MAVSPHAINLPFNEMQLRQAISRSDGQPDYVGQAPRGVASNQAAWTIYKFTYTSNNLTLRQIAYKTAWDSRTTGDYA